MKMKRMCVMVTVLLLMAGSCWAGADFPLRAKYPAVKTISTADLKAGYDDTIIVDVRSSIEFEVIHINKAVSAQVSKGNFLTELEKIRAKGGITPIAFYCNGHTCAKSYKATIKAMDAGFSNVFVYDAGIYDWVKANPELGTLMGATPVPVEKLISKAALKAKKVDYPLFKGLAAKGGLVVDIREPFQRAKNPDLPQNKMLALSGVRNIPMDRLVPLLKQKKFTNKKLLIVDAVGKQVRWLQYHLEGNGYSNYVFLDKGALGAAEAGGVR